MDIGRVVGNVVSTIRNEAMSVSDLLLIVEYEHGGREAAVDTVRSGIGDRVLITHGTAAQRKTWLARGYQTGDRTQCDTFSAAAL